MQKWEYKAVSLCWDHDVHKKAEDSMNQLGGDGWELASTIGAPSQNFDHVRMVLMVFKRPIPA